MDERRREPGQGRGGGPLPLLLGQAFLMFYTATMSELGTFLMRPIGYVESPYSTPEEIPKGPGTKHEAEGTLVIDQEFAEGLTDIEGFSHLFVIWVFHLSQGFHLMAQPPTADRPHGVFATRSPHRPNPIGLTVVELYQRQGNLLRVKGVDMVNGTPILDIKPYLSSVPEEKLCRGWLANQGQSS